MSNVTLTSLPHDIFHYILSCSDVDVRDILALKQTCRVLRATIRSILANSPAIYRAKLVLLAKTIPTGLPRDLSNFKNKELETAALTAYAVEKYWRRPAYGDDEPIQSYNVDVDHLPACVGVKVVPGGRWVVAVSDLGWLSVWDTINENIVAQCDCGFRPRFMELEAVARGQVVVAVSGRLLVGDVSWNVLSVYSLTMPPKSRYNTLLVKKGCVSAVGYSHSLSISGPLVCQVYYDREIQHLRILIYDWHTNCGDILEVNGMHFEDAPKAIISPHAIILFTLLSAYRPALSYIKIPQLSDLSKYSQNDMVEPIVPPFVTVVPENIKQPDGSGYGSDGDFVAQLSLVVKRPDSSTSPSSISLIYLAVEPSARQLMACGGLEVEWSSNEAMDITGEPRSWNLRLGHTVCERYDLPDPVAHLVAIGATTRQAVWAMKGLDRTSTVVTMARPSIIGREDNGDERVRDEYLPRRCRIHNSAGLAERPIALGFDESTSTVAIGGENGKVLVCIFGPRGAVRR